MMKRFMHRFCLTTLFLGLVGCSIFNATAKENGVKLNVKEQDWGQGPNGESVKLFTLTNDHGMKMTVTNYGAIIVSLFAPDRNGNFEDIVFGFDKVSDYWKQNSPFFGAIVGRYGNRIAKGQFTLDGKTYTLAKNNDANHLHGGVIGFDKQVWKAKDVKEKDAVGVRLTLRSDDMQEGYPGDLKVRVTYWLTNDNAVRIEYLATTDKTTVVNLTNHSYFNLDGQNSDTNLDHLMMINADFMTPVDETLIPTGEITPVKGTAFDFTQPMAIGARVNADEAQIKYGNGYDHNFVLNKEWPGQMSMAARVAEPDSGRIMEVYTTEPGVQFYGGNFLDSTHTGKGGIVYKFRSGFCLETQHFPDSPNQPWFPTTTLTPDEKYETTTIYKFSAK